MKLRPFLYRSAQVALDLTSCAIRGEDAASFLDGQSTQALSSVWKFHVFVDRTGRIESYFLARTTASGVEALVPSDIFESFQQRFENFVVSEDVTLSDASSSKWWIAMGPEQLALEADANLAGERAFISQNPFPGVDVVSESTWIEWSLAQGIPLLSKSEGIGELVNQSTLFSAGVSLSKGCFPGQEVVAKIHNNRGAAWAPTLLQLIEGARPLTSEILLEGKVVAKLQLDRVIDEKYFHATVLRDMRVDGIEVVGPDGQRFRTKSLPLYAQDSRQRALDVYHLGTDEFAKGNEDAAAQAWELAIKIDPSFADAYEAMGVMLGRQKKYAEGEAWMRRLLVADPDSIMAHTNLSLFLMQQNRIQEAEDHKAKATLATFASYGRKASTERALKEQAAKVESERQQREAMFRQVLEIDPDDPLANHGLGTISLERGDYASAQSYLESVLRADPNYAVAYLALGKALSAQGLIDEARNVWSDGVKVAAKRGELMPANEMQSLLLKLS